MREIRLKAMLLPLLASLFFGQASLVFGQFGGSDVPEELKTGWDTITPDQASQWLHILAGPKFEGRGSGQAGYTRAAHWVAGKVAEFGLQPMGDAGTYFQMLPMSRLTLDAAESKLSGPGDFAIPVGPQLGFSRYGEVGEVSGEVVVVTLSGRQPVIDESIPLREKIVLYVADDEANFAAQRLFGRSGAAAVLQVIDGDSSTGSQMAGGGGRQRNTGLAGTIRRDAAEKLIVACGGEPGLLKAAEGVTYQAKPAGNTATLRLRTRTEPASIPNVVAWLPGSDPALKDEYIVIGSHLDHLGTRNGEMYPGADDNGSGSTAVLSIARAMAENPVKPKRSVLFIWFAAEEIGLQGSAFYVDNPRLPLEKMNCMFNIDMVGRNEEQEGDLPADNMDSVHLVGSKRGDSGLHDVIMRANESVGFKFEYDEEDVFGRSDQANFYKKGTSVAFLFGGFHPDYHRTGDGPDKINYNKIAAAARLYYLSIHYASEHGPFPIPTDVKPAGDGAGGN